MIKNKFGGNEISTGRLSRASTKSAYILRWCSYKSSSFLKVRRCDIIRFDLMTQIHGASPRVCG